MRAPELTCNFQIEFGCTHADEQRRLRGEQLLNRAQTGASQQAPAATRSTALGLEQGLDITARFHALRAHVRARDTHEAQLGPVSSQGRDQPGAKPIVGGIASAHADAYRLSLHGAGF